MKKLIAGHSYRVKKSFCIKCKPLKYYALQNEILNFKGKSLGYAHLYGKNPFRLVLLTKREAFEFLEEIK